LGIFQMKSFEINEGKLVHPKNNSAMKFRKLPILSNLGKYAM
jgi:hypothetical protein